MNNYSLNIFRREWLDCYYILKNLGVVFSFNLLKVIFSYKIILKIKNITILNVQELKALVIFI